MQSHDTVNMSPECQCLGEYSLGPCANMSIHKAFAKSTLFKEQEDK